MKRTLLILLCIPILACCGKDNKQLAEMEILSKTIVLNDNASEGLALCSERKENSKSNCVFYLNGKRFLKRISYVFSNGIFKELDIYRSEGPVSYDLATLNSDSELQKLYQTKNQLINFVPGVGIIDSGDTISNYSIDKENRLILADKSNFKKTNLSDKESVIYAFE